MRGHHDWSLNNLAMTVRWLSHAFNVFEIGDGMFQLSLLNTDICQSCCKCEKVSENCNLLL